MHQIILSEHAERRCQQRGFQTAHIEILIKYGQKHRKPGNAYEVTFTKKCEKKMSRRDKKENCQTLDKIKNKAVLLDGDLKEVITVYNKLEKFTN